MLIQSQDRKVIVNTNTLVCLYREKCDIRCITTNSEDDYGYLMGSYQTEDEAQRKLNQLLILAKEM